MKRPSPSRHRDLLLTYYYPWYVQGDWSRHAYQGTPLLGLYGTDQPHVAEQHIEWLTQHGIDGLLVSWWGPGHLVDEHLGRGLLRARNLDSIRFAFWYESVDLLQAETGAGEHDDMIDFARPEQLERMKLHFADLRDRFFDHPSYLRIGGRPVVALYATRIWTHFQPAHLEALKEHLGTDLYVIADEVYNWSQRYPQTAQNGIRPDGQPVFDAYTAYIMYRSFLAREGELASEYLAREALPVYARWARETVLVPGVFPAYHDFRGNALIRGSPEDFRASLRAVKALPFTPMDDEIDRMFTVTSFNEWWEGSTIEPAEEYGTSYLEVLRQEFR